MSKFIDLTHVIAPSDALRKFSIEIINPETVNPNVIKLEDQWYIMSNINMVSHIATHIESPYHVLRTGKDLSQISLDTLFGDAVMIDLSDLPAKSAISAESVKAAAEKAGGIKKGDIVICNLGYADHYNTEKYSESPYFTTEAINYLVQSGMKMMGVDAGGVEIPQSEEHVNHHALLSNDIPLIENVANLNAVKASRFKIYAFVLPVAGLESFPLRVVAEVE